MRSISSHGRKGLRKQLREARRSLSPAQQRQAARNLLTRLRGHPVFVKHKSIAFYMAADGEIDPLLLARAALNRGKHCYLPIMHPFIKGRLLFGRYQQKKSLKKNAYGLLEPAMGSRRMPAWALGLVLMPLVGFDRNGNRLGMGGGFYDQSFAFKHTHSKPRSPTLMGLAHWFQEVPSLQQQKWDVAMEWIATDREVISVA